MVTDGRTDQLMDRLMDGWTNEWTNKPFYTDAMDASENDDFPTDFAIFTKSLRTNRPTDQGTNGTMDKQTNRSIDQRFDGQTYPIKEMR